MDDYMKYLIEQYKKARGIIGIDINSSEFKDDFDKWLKKQQENGINYASFLYSIGIDIINCNTAEVNKGNFDSLVIPYDTTIVSPYFNDVDRDNVVNELFIINSIIPYYNNFNHNIFRYMTHNPYSNFDNEILMNWKNMHEYTRYDIVLGMFGNLYDEDKNNKIKKLELLKSKLTIDYVEEYDIVNDSYYYVIATKPKIKKKI